MQDPRDAHKKKPWLAAVLNLIPLPLSLGYAYLDRPVRFAVSLAVRCVVAVVSKYYLDGYVTSCRSGDCHASAGAWALIIVPPLVVLASTA